ncbi:MAG: hypothetical protein ACPHCI_01190 [Solirubrobacterales bacterium]
MEFTGPGAGTTAMFLETASNAGSLTIDNVTSTSVEGYHLLIQRNVGAVTVTDSTFTNTASSLYTAIIDSNYFLGAGWPTTGLHRFSGNTIDAQRGISIQAGFFGFYPGRPFTAGVQIDGNTINQLTSTESPGTAAGRSIVEVVNSATDVNGTDGGAPPETLLPSVSVTDNVLTGNGAANGITLTGRMDGPVVTGNNIRGNSIGVRMLKSAITGATALNIPTNVNLTRNQIVGNSTTGVSAAAGEAITADATNTWWGCNDGPGQTGCDTVTQPATDVDADPWAVLSIAPDDTVLGPAATTAVNAAINTNSDGDAIAGFLFDGTAFAFSGSGGSVAPGSAPTTNSIASSDFTSSGLTGRSATATFDNEALTYNWTDYDTNAPVITILSPVNGSTVSTPNVTLTFTVLDDLDPNPVCSPLSGSTVALTEVANTIVVTCEDSAGNIGTASVTVNLDTTKPVVNILTPQDNTSVASSVTFSSLTYEVADYGDPAPICTPVNGANIPLVDGLNTITVTCVDAAGNVGTDTVKVTRLPAGVVPSGPADPLPSCARDLMITNVRLKGRKSLISGVARLRFANQRVSIYYRPTGRRVVARPRVAANGSFTAVVNRPRSPRAGSNRARYRAAIGGQKSAWVKLTRRLRTSNVRYDGSKLRVRGRVTQPIIRGRTVHVNRSDACGRYRKIGNVRVKRNGTFSGAVTTPATTDGNVALIRLIVRVRTGGRGKNRNRTFTTYSIVQPVLLAPR